MCPKYEKRPFPSTNSQPPPPPKNIVYVMLNIYVTGVQTVLGLGLRQGTGAGRTLKSSRRAGGWYCSRQRPKPSACNYCFHPVTWTHFMGEPWQPYSFDSLCREHVWRSTVHCASEQRADRRLTYQSRFKGNKVRQKLCLYIFWDLFLLEKWRLQNFGKYIAIVNQQLHFVI